MVQEEIWKAIVDDKDDFTGLYEVSNCGRIRRYDGHIMSQHKTLSGYHMVNLVKNKKRHPKMVSRLVAFAFVYNENPKEKTQVNHITEDKDHNESWFLEWVTPKENANYGTRNEKLSALRSKPVAQIDLATNEVICTFNSVKEARDKTNIRTIWETLYGKQKQSGGYGWKLITA